MPRQEYDREHEAIIEDKGRALGLLGAWGGDTDWYGGRIQQIGRLVENKGEFTVLLQKPQKRRTHRYARFAGSRRILILKTSGVSAAGAAKNFCAQKFILLGRVFIPFHTKDDTLYMVEVNEDWERTPDKGADRFRFSLADFVAVFNPLELNNRQVSFLLHDLLIRLIPKSTSPSPSGRPDGPLGFQMPSLLLSSRGVTSLV